MPDWVTPPTFATGRFLRASEMATIADDIEFLYGEMRGPIAAQYAGQASGDATYNYAGRHTYAYLHWSLTYISGGTSFDEIELAIYTLDGSQVGAYVTLWTRTGDGPNPVTANTELSGIEEIHSARSLTYGTFYKYQFRISETGGGSVSRMNYVFECPDAS